MQWFADWCEAERKEAEKEAARLHVEARLAEVDAKNAALASAYGDIDSLLAWTFDVDDFVDLESLRVTVNYPALALGELERPLPEVPELVYPAQPVYVEPTPPKGISSALGGKSKHGEAIQRAKVAHEQASHQWHAFATQQYNHHLQMLEARKVAEARRLAELEAARQAHMAECARLETDAARRNGELTRLMNELAFDVESAIEDYVGIVLSNSVYPDSFPVEHEHSFDLATRELTLRVDIPGPSSLPNVKEYRYVKAKDEIAESLLPAKAQKDLYASAVHQVSLRTLHEVFEADRAGKIHSVALTVGVKRVSPATGQPEHVPLAVVAADRATFTSFDLAQVVPVATLEHLGAAISKSPFDLTPVDTGRDVRHRGR